MTIDRWERVISPDFSCWLHRCNLITEQTTNDASQCERNTSKWKLNQRRNSRGFWYFMACTGLQVYSVHELKGSISRRGCIVFVMLSFRVHWILFNQKFQSSDLWHFLKKKTKKKNPLPPGHRWSCGLSVWCLGRMSETERGMAGCVGVKGRGVEKRVMCSFPFCSAWWLQALDFQRPHLPPLKSVWKLHPPGWMWAWR